MAKDRLTLHNELMNILGSDKVYFQPPSTIKMKYPCIIYIKDAEDPTYANDKRYLGLNRYLVTVVDENPDSLIPDKVVQLPYCAFADNFSVDNLNHVIYSLYY